MRAFVIGLVLISVLCVRPPQPPTVMKDASTVPELHQKSQFRCGGDLSDEQSTSNNNYNKYMHAEWDIDDSKINTCRFTFTVCHTDYPSDYRGKGAVACFNTGNKEGFLATGSINSRQKMFMPTWEEDVVMVRKNPDHSFYEYLPKDDPLEGDWFETNWVNAQTRGGFRMIRNMIPNKDSYTIANEEGNPYEVDYQKRGSVANPWFGSMLCWFRPFDNSPIVWDTSDSSWEQFGEVTIVDNGCQAKSGDSSFMEFPWVKPDQKFERYYDGPLDLEGTKWRRYVCDPDFFPLMKRTSSSTLYGIGGICAALYAVTLA